MTQGVITAPTGAVAALVALADATPVTGSLGGMMKDAFVSSDGLQIAVLNFGVNKACLFPAGTNIATVTGATNVSIEGVYTQVDPTKRGTVEWTYTPDGAASFTGYLGNDGGTVGSGVLGNKPARYSWESLVNAIDDVSHATVSGMAATGFAAIVVADQSVPSITVYQVPLGANAANAHTAAVALAESVQYVLTVQPAGDRQPGE